MQQIRRNRLSAAQAIEVFALSLTNRSTRTPTLAMASPFYWPVLVPYGLTASGAG
jgi:hypothetical protein